MFRDLRSHPTLSVVAVLSLALGIGANTAIFSLIDALILKPLPVAHPEELVQVMMGHEAYGAFSNPTWEHLRDRQDIFSGIFAYGRWGFNLAPGGEVRQVNGNYVSGQYFETLVVRPSLGRVLAPSDDRRGCPGAAVLSYGFWQREYGGRADIVGQTISIDRHSIAIVGVGPRGFNGAEVGGSADVILPLCAVPVVRSGDASLLETNYIPVGWLQIIGRMKAGISASQASARLQALAPEVYRSTLADDPRRVRREQADEYLSQTLDVFPAANGISYLRREYHVALAVLMALVGLVLLIACANVASLLLARGEARRREIAIRVALGAGRGRLLRQFLTESLLLSTTGAALGVLFAAWGARALTRFLDASIDLSPDWRMLAFTAGVAVASGLLFGIAPAWRATRVDPHAALKVKAGGEGGRLRFGRVLVAVQVALSVLLVAGASLLIATFWRLITRDAGFDRDQVLLVNPSPSGRNLEMRERSHTAMLDLLRAVPGVASASLSTVTPVCHCRASIDVEGVSKAAVNAVSDRYFETIGTPILAGRDFDAHDTATSPKVAIVSRSLGKPVGSYLRVGEGRTPVEVVGVVKDAMYGSLRDIPQPYVFLPWSQGSGPGPLASFELRPAGGSPAGLIPAVKAAIPGELSVEFRTLSDKVDDSLQRERLLASLSGFFGGLALVLASLGLYGVMAFNVERRSGEIGIRMALGAPQGRVLGMVLGEVAALIGIGLAAGLGATLATTHFLASFLFGSRPNDPVTLFAAAAVLTAVSLLAGFLPARRASRIDPLAALRED